VDHARPEGLTSDEAQELLWGEHERRCQRFASFQAATAARDVFDIDLAMPRNDGSTEPYTLRPLWELAPTLLSVPARGVGPTGSAKIGSAPHEAPVSGFDVLDELRTPNGQIKGHATAFRRGGGLPYRERLVRSSAPGDGSSSREHALKAMLDQRRFGSAPRPSG
jgi:hypothetical protein